MIAVAAVVAAAIALQLALRRRAQPDWIDDARPETSCLMITQVDTFDARPTQVGTVVWRGGERRKVVGR